MRRVLLVAGMLAVTACSTGRPEAATLDVRNDRCASCRMAVSSPRFAAQLVAPGEDPLFFDDLGCLVTYLGQHPSVDARAVAYVADHRTGAWVPAAGATITRVDGLGTPMGSHLIAHASSASRDADPAARTGLDVRLGSLLAAPVPDGAR
jgi:copper chaperone NosL